VPQVLVTANIVSKQLILFTLMMEVICASETSVRTTSKRRNIPEDDILHSHRPEDLKSREKSFRIDCNFGLFCLNQCLGTITGSSPAVPTDSSGRRRLVWIDLIPVGHIRPAAHFTASP
jgi:hypothetical protein